jgi:hypothetical protein
MEQKNVCPNCGYCPHCGRGAHQPMIPAPYQPYPFPYSPNYPPIVWGGNGVIDTQTVTSGDSGLGNMIVAYSNKVQ